MCSSDLAGFLDQVIGTALLLLMIFAITDERNTPPGSNMTPIMVGLVVLLTISAARARADHPRPGHGRDGAVTGRARARPATRRTPAR